MSLIGVFRCGNGAVLLADSQETHQDPDTGDYFKTEVNKIQMYGESSRRVAYAGASVYADLVDGLGARIGAWARRSEATETEEIRAELAGVVADFCATTEYKIYPASDESKRIDAIVCVITEPWHQRQVDVFRIAASVVHVVPDFDLLGINYQYIKPIAQRRHRRDMSESDAYLLGLYLFKNVMRTSGYVGAPIRVALVRSTDMHVQNQALTDVHLWHVTAIIETLEEVVFAAPNLEWNDDTMKTKWDSTCNSMTALRESFRQDIAGHIKRERGKV